MEFVINVPDEIFVSHAGVALAGAVRNQSPFRERLLLPDIEIPTW